jgi:DNA polymerase I-like protein with 3'-5' exonuclease and polymerase domains
MHNRLGQPRDTGQYNVAGTDSFRLSCKMMLSSKLKSSPYHNFGGNRQNIEKEMRELWIADEGYSFVQVDQSGAEALIVAHLCKSAKYRQLFQHGVKPHTYLALKLFWKEFVKEGFPEKDILTALATPIAELRKLPFWDKLAKFISSSDNWSDSKRYYHMAKKTIHAGSYGMRGNTFRLQMLKESGGKIVLTADQADAFLEGFHKEFPEIREWHSRTYAMVKQKGELRNLFEYPFRVTSTVNESDFKDLIAWVPQSTVACITRQAFIKLQSYIEHEKKDWHLMADTHDSYMCMVPDAEVKEAATIMKQFIEIELKSPYDDTLFRMKSEAQAGKNWAPSKEKKDTAGNIIVINPEGLKEVA